MGGRPGGSKGRSWALQTAPQTWSEFHLTSPCPPFLPTLQNVEAQGKELPNLPCHIGYIPPQNAHLCTWGWLEHFPNPGRVPAASMLLLSQLQPGERLWEPGQQGILHPLRSSPRALWGSGFKAGQSLHLMWNREPAGIISHSLHLFPHAPKPVYPAWL